MSNQESKEIERLVAENPVLVKFLATMQAQSITEKAKLRIKSLELAGVHVDSGIQIRAANEIYNYILRDSSGNIPAESDKK